MIVRGFWILGAALVFHASSVSPAAASAVGDAESARIVSLEGIWKLRAGDDPAWVRPDFDDSGWPEIRVPTGRGIAHPEASDLAWYRRTVRLVAPDGHGELGLTLGKIDSAYEVYAGGILLGGVGALPPAPRMEYDRHRTYPVPERAIAPDGLLTVALRVWKSPARRGDVGGPYAGPFLVGDLPELVRRQVVSELPALFAAGLVLVAGLFHLLIYRLRPELKEYLWFCLLATAAAAYSVLRTQWKYALTDRFALLKEVEHLILYLLPVLFIQMMWPLLGLKIGRVLRGFQWVCLAAGAAVALSPGLELNARVHRVWMPVLAVLIAGGLWTLLREAWRGHAEARIVAGGAVAACAAGFHDLAAYAGWLHTPNLIPYGHAILVLAMAVSLADRFIRAFSELETKAEHERRVSAELEVKNAELERFTYTVSHDLKSPLVTIRGFLGLLRRDVERGDRERVDDDIRRIEGATDTMRLLLHDLLELSRIGRVVHPPQEVPFGELVREALARTSGPIAERGVDVEVAPGLPTVRGDRERLVEVLQNLIENAVKYLGEEPSPRIEIGVEAGRDGPVFFVRDNGIGIDPRYHDLIFGLFERLDADTEGTGVGLALVKRIVEIHGGRIRVESEGRGRGSTFRFTLPGSDGQTAERAGA